jgi:hypothetical protein
VRAGARKGKAAAKTAAPAPIERVSPAEEAAYVEAVILSGEAARPDERGKLPAGATHTIVEDGTGTVKVIRRRFSIT